MPVIALISDDKAIDVVLPWASAFAITRATSLTVICWTHSPVASSACTWSRRSGSDTGVVIRVRRPSKPNSVSTANDRSASIFSATALLVVSRPSGVNKQTLLVEGSLPSSISTASPNASMSAARPLGTAWLIQTDSGSPSGAAGQREKIVGKSLKDIKGMTLTVIDGNFPREVLANQNLAFTTYRMPARRNTSRFYDAKSKRPAANQRGVLFQGKVSFNKRATDSDEKVAVQSNHWPVGLSAMLSLAVIGLVLIRRRRLKHPACR